MLAIIFGIIVAIFTFVLSKDYFKNPKKFLSLILVFILTSVLVYLALLNIIVNVEESYNIILGTPYSIYDKMVLFLISMSLSIFLDAIFAIIIQKIHENRLINNYEKAYNNYNYDYYREILQSESPAIFSYCYNKKINVEDEVVAIMLNLKLKNLIDFDNQGVRIIGNISSLSEHEKYVLYNINKLHNNDETQFKNTFKNLLMEDLKKANYVYTLDESEVNIVSIMEIFMLWMILYVLVSIPIFITLSSIGMLIFVAYGLTFVGIPIYKLIQSKINPVIKAEKALELTGKLKGLKNYISDYSIIKDTGIENVNLYNEYVIYAIIFNIQGKLNTECKQIYKNIKNILRNS